MKVCEKEIRCAEDEIDCVEKEICDEINREMKGDMMSAGHEMMNTENEFKMSTGWSMALGILMIVFGMAAMAFPFLAGLAVSLVVAWLLIFSGCAHIAYAWQKSIGYLILESLLGILYVVAGGFMLMNPAVGLATLTVVFAIYLVIESIINFVMAFRLRPVPGSGWLVVHGIVSIFLAVMIWQGWPVSAIWMIGVLVGINMIFSGIARFMLARESRRELLLGGALAC